MKYNDLLTQALFWDKKNNFKQADVITNYLIKKSQLIEKIDLESGLNFNDPKSIKDYFLGYAYDIYKVDLDASKFKINAELEKLFKDKSITLNASEISELNKIKADVMSELVNSQWYINLPEFEQQIMVSKGNETPITFDSNSSGFENAFKYILQAEGGYSSYDPESDDPATNLGIIQSEYDSYRMNKNLPSQSVQNIVMDEAKEIYFNDYWSAINAETLYSRFPKLAITLFDFAVNSGIGGASKLVSKVLNIPSQRFNSQMIEQISEFAENFGDSETTNLLIENRYSNYEDIVRRNPKKQKFLKGWFNRLNKLKTYLG